MVKFVIGINRQRKAAENLELFFPYFAKLFNYIIENHIKPVNIYNSEEKKIFISYNKRLHVVVRKNHKNLHLVLYSSQKLVTVVQFIYADLTKLLWFVIF